MAELVREDVTKVKYEQLFKQVEDFTLKEVRHMFTNMRREGVDHNTLCTRLGITIGEFATGYTLKPSSTRKPRN